MSSHKFFTHYMKQAIMLIKNLQEVSIMKKLFAVVAVMLCFTVQTRAKAEADPYDRFANSLNAVAAKIQRGNHTIRDGNLRLWSGRNYVLVTYSYSEGDGIARFFTTDSDMMFAGGIRISHSRSRDIQRFFGDGLTRYEGVLQIGGIHQWVEFDVGSRNGVLRSINFTQADVELSPSIKIAFEENMRRLSR